MSERRIGMHERPRFPQEAILVCGDVAFVQVGVERAGTLAEALRRGDATPEDIHPLYAGIRFGAVGRSTSSASCRERPGTRRSGPARRSSRAP